MDELHQHVAAVGLSVLGRYGFALAGGGAIQIHGIVDRPSDDVDLFTNEPDPAKFERAGDEAVAAWQHAGFTVTNELRAETFARFLLTARDGGQVRVELSYDWRADPPVVLDVGPVLSADDSVANKVTALFGRQAARDYIDVHAALTKGYTQEHLESLGLAHDRGFDLPMFAQALRGCASIADPEFTRYGLSGDQVHRMRVALIAWADDIDGR